MNFITQLFIALATGAYTITGLNLYSKQIEKTKNDFTRLILYIIALGLFFVIPILGIEYISTLKFFGKKTSSFFIIIVWVVFMVAFVIKNRKTLSNRLAKHQNKRKIC